MDPRPWGPGGPLAGILRRSTGTGPGARGQRLVALRRGHDRRATCAGRSRSGRHGRPVLHRRRGDLLPADGGGADAVRRRVPCPEALTGAGSRRVACPASGRDLRRGLGRSGLRDRADEHRRHAHGAERLQLHEYAAVRHGRPVRQRHHDSADAHQTSPRRRMGRRSHRRPTTCSSPPSATCFSTWHADGTDPRGRVGWVLMDRSPPLPPRPDDHPSDGAGGHRFPRLTVVRLGEGDRQLPGGRPRGAGPPSGVDRRERTAGRDAARRGRSWSEGSHRPRCIWRSHAT